jgi:hypothetical protein
MRVARVLIDDNQVSPSDGDYSRSSAGRKDAAPSIRVGDDAMAASLGSRRLRGRCDALRGRVPGAHRFVAPFENALAGSELIAERVVDLGADRQRVSEANDVLRGDEHDSKLPVGNRPRVARDRRSSRFAPRLLLNHPPEHPADNHDDARERERRLPRSRNRRKLDRPASMPLPTIAARTPTTPSKTKSPAT